MKTYVIGDLHGAYKALVQCLERSGFNKEEDTLIQLGDVADGWGQTFECVEELLTITNLFKIKGNHDDWFREWIENGIHGSSWSQGAFATLKSYGANCLGQGWEDFQVTWNGHKAITNLTPDHIPPTHRQFFMEQKPYMLWDANDKPFRCFVHGGFNRHMDFEGQFPDYIYWWDRDLWSSALSYEGMKGRDGYKFKMKTPFEEVFIGHTQTTFWGKDTPMKCANVWNLDTGAGWDGKLTIMDVDTKEYWQSDTVQTLYPDEKGRK